MVVTAGFRMSDIFLTVLTISFLLIIPSALSKKLETVSDNEFLKLVQTEKFVVVLFSKFLFPLLTFLYILNLNHSLLYSFDFVHIHSHESIK